MEPVLLVRAGLMFGLIGGGKVSAQSLEPRAYANTPVGMNFALIGYAHTEGSITTEASSPIQNAQVTTDNALLGYSRSFGLLGTSGKIALVEGEAWVSGQAQFMGQPRSRYVTGLTDPLVRGSINLYGAPALTMNEFTNYQQNLIIGMSLSMTAPLGQYDSSKLLNIGQNRWSFRPELGFSQAYKKFTFELMPAVTFFTDNNNFLGQTKEQDPLYSLQGHVIYSFPKNIWASVSATYYTGGSTTLDGKHQNDLEKDYRVGATLSLPLGRHESIKLYGSDGVVDRAGQNFWLIGIALQYRWGGGL